MRSFSKKLAFVLAAAMVVTAFAPAAKAEAAKEMAINKSSQILYVNEGINHKGADGVAAGKGNVSVYDFSVKNKPADWKTAYSFAWSSSDEDVVSVAKGGVATAVGVGKATVYCKVTEKATKEVTTLKTKVTVKANAYDVEITNADKWDGATVEVNGVVDLNRAMYDEDGNKTTKRGTLVTDYTKWVAEPAAGVEIDQKTGKFTFTEAAVAGEYKLSCYTYQSSKYTEKTAESDVVVVEFQKEAFVLDQTASNGFNLLFSQKADVKIADVLVNKIIKVGDGTGKLPQVVSNVVMSEDKKTASVSLFTNFENGTTYEISVKGYDDVATLVAYVGAPVSMTINTRSWMNGGAMILTGDGGAELYHTLWDDQGNDVTNTVYGTVVYSPADLATSDYYVDDKFVYIYKNGAQAVVNAEFHTGVYDENAQEKTFKATGIFVGVDQAIESVAGVNLWVEKWSYKFANNNIPVSIGWDDNGDGSQLLDVKLQIKTTQYNDGFNDYHNEGLVYKLAAGDKVPMVRFRSSDPDVLDIYADNKDKVVLFKEGTAAILADLVTWNDDGSENVVTIAAVTINVTAKSKISGVAFPSGSNMVVGAETAYDTATLHVVAKDQYGFEWGLGNWMSEGFKEITFADGTEIFKYNWNLPANERTNGGVVYLDPRDGGNGYRDSIVVKGNELFREMIRAGYVTIVVKGDATKTPVAADAFDPSQTYDWYVGGKKVTSVSKRIIVVTDANTPGNAKDEVKFTFNVTVKQPVGNDVLAISTGNTTTSGNIARYSTWYDGNDGTEYAKNVTFQVFNTRNGVTTDLLDLADVKAKNNLVPDDYATDSALGTLFFTITRDGKAIDEYGNVNYTVGGNSVTVNFNNEVTMSDVYNADGSVLNSKYFTYKDGYNDIGAGKYVFSLYKVAYNQGANKYYFAFVGSSTANVTYDDGNYFSLVRRTAEYIDANDISDATVRSCFTIKDNRTGAENNMPYSVDYEVSNNFVHVKSITVYDEVKVNGVVQGYAPYTININVSLKKGY